MTEERKEKLQKQIQEAMQSEEVCAALLMCGDAEKVNEVLKKYNIDASLEEIIEISNVGNLEVQKVKESEGNELALEQLEDVVGGAGFWRGVAAITGGAVLGFGMGVVCGVCPAFTPVATKIGVGYAVGAGAWVATGN